MAMMHFCPSLECRKWYHASCLEISRSIDTSPVETRGLRLLATDPDSEAPFATFAYFAERESAEDLMSIDQVILTPVPLDFSLDFPSSCLLLD